MTANKNEPDKKTAGSAPSQAGNRPHATLDLKATEVAAPAKEATKDKPTVAATPDKAAPAAGASAASGAGKVEGKTDQPAGPPPSSAPAARPAARGSGGFFTHMAAGLAG